MCNEQSQFSLRHHQRRRYGNGSVRLDLFITLYLMPEHSVNAITQEHNELGSPNLVHGCISWRPRTSLYMGHQRTFQSHRGQLRKLPETACERDNLRMQWARITKLVPWMHLMKTSDEFVYGSPTYFSKSQRST